MRYLKPLALIAIAAVVLLAAGTVAPAQIGIGVNIGPAPICPYGYFDYAPYDCGPDWFLGGVFLGAGPWFHGPRGFYGHVDNRYDPRNGYHGPLPDRGAKPFTHFQGNEARDGQGHVGNAPHAPTNEHSGGFQGMRGGSRGGGGGHHR
jgi:uncharacterized membrane protein YgcG